jgi:hypothetical protein
MNLNLNSTSAKLYRWFYAAKEMPQSLCPYFWKLAIMWLLILPYTIVSLPHIIMNGKGERSTAGERAGIGFVIWGILCMLICMLSLIGLFFAIPTKDSLYMHTIAIGITGWLLSIVFGCIELFKFLKRKWDDREITYDEDGRRIWNPVKEKKSSIFKEFVRAKYNKYCPKINWK